MGRDFAPEEISAIILQKLGQDAAAFLGDKVRTCRHCVFLEVHIRTMPTAEGEFVQGSPYYSKPLQSRCLCNPSQLHALCLMPDPDQADPPEAPSSIVCHLVWQSRT